ncbi:hypothetical protein GCM10010505_46940 [Kitasatospora aburaviensis]
MRASRLASAPDSSTKVPAETRPIEPSRAPLLHGSVRVRAGGLGPGDVHVVLLRGCARFGEAGLFAAPGAFWGGRRRPPVGGGIRRPSKRPGAGRWRAAGRFDSSGYTLEMSSNARRDSSYGGSTAAVRR